MGRVKKSNNDIGNKFRTISKLIFGHRHFRKLIKDLNSVVRIIFFLGLIMLFIFAAFNPGFFIIIILFLLFLAFVGTLKY